MALLKQTVASQEEKIENLEEEVKELNKKLEEALRVGVQEQKKKKRGIIGEILHTYSLPKKLKIMYMLNPILMNWIPRFNIYKMKRWC